MGWAQRTARHVLIDEPRRGAIEGDDDDLGAAAATAASKVLAHSSMRAPARTLQHHGMKAMPQHGIQLYLHLISFPFLLHRIVGSALPTMRLALHTVTIHAMYVVLMIVR